MKYARIKQDALVGMDFSAYRWPKVPCPLREQIRLPSGGYNSETVMLSKFFDRVFKLDEGSKFKASRTRVWANGFGILGAPSALNLYGSGSLYVKLDDLVEATESEFLKSESEITAYVESIDSAQRTMDNVISTSQEGRLQQLIERCVSEDREINCRRTEVQNERCRYAFVVLKPSLEMFEDDNCDGGGYRSWNADMEDILADDWYEIVQVDIKEDGNVKI